MWAEHNPERTENESLVYKVRRVRKSISLLANSDILLRWRESLHRNNRGANQKLTTGKRRKMKVNQELCFLVRQFVSDMMEILSPDEELLLTEAAGSSEQKFMSHHHHHHQSQT